MCAHAKSSSEFALVARYFHAEPNRVCTHKVNWFGSPSSAPSLLESPRPPPPKTPKTTTITTSSLKAFCAKISEIDFSAGLKYIEICFLA